MGEVSSVTMFSNHALFVEMDHQVAKVKEVDIPIPRDTSRGGLKSQGHFNLLHPGPFYDRLVEKFFEVLRSDLSLGLYRC